MIYLWEETMLILLLLIGVLVAVLIFTKKINYLYTLVFTLFIVYFISNPSLCIESALMGLRLFIKAVFPTLFPFLTFCNLLIFYDGITLYSNIIGPIICTPLRLSKQCSLPLTISFLCGYPLGAKYSTELLEGGYISQEEYLRLINIASNIGPLFIIGSFATTMLGNSYFGYLLLIANYLSCFIMSILIKPAITRDSNIPITISKRTNLGEALKKSLEDATKTCITVAGFIVLFSVITYVIKNNIMYTHIILYISKVLKIDKGLINSIALGMIETTNGSYLLSITTGSIRIRLSLASFLFSFSGFSVIAQVHSFTYKHKFFNLTRYTLRKLVQGIVSFAISYIVFTVAFISNAVINIPSYWNINLYFVPMLIIMVLSLIAYVMSFLFNRS